MSFDTRVTWEKLLMEIRSLQPDESQALVPILIGTHAILKPRDQAEKGFRDVHYLAFEFHRATEGLDELQRLEELKTFFFENKGFKFKAKDQLREEDFCLSSVLAKREGHPLLVTLLFLHIAAAADLPVCLIEAREQYIVKHAREPKSVYLDVTRNALQLTDSAIFKILQKSSANLEVWDARTVYRRYLEELMKHFDATKQTQCLHTVYNLYLHLDESNLPILARRALLRQRLGFGKEAMTDLKRYFSFVDRGHAPIELQQAMMDLETASEDFGGNREPLPGPLH